MPVGKSYQIVPNALVQTAGLWYFRATKIPLKMKFGILREGKVPPDKRVPFSPPQCKTIKHKFGADVVVQRSPIRAFSDEEYEESGITLVENV